MLRKILLHQMFVIGIVATLTFQKLVLVVKCILNQLPAAKMLQTITLVSDCHCRFGGGSHFACPKCFWHCNAELNNRKRHIYVKTWKQKSVMCQMFTDVSHIYRCVGIAKLMDTTKCCKVLWNCSRKKYGIQKYWKYLYCCKIYLAQYNTIDLQ